MDDLLKGRLKILQKKKGYRFSLDALLLTHFADIADGETVSDLGTGSGVIPLILASRGRASKIVGCEIQDDLAEMARRSVRMNGLDPLIEIITCNIAEVSCRFGPTAFDVVLCNPPYRKIRSGRINPDSQKAVARHELKGTLADFVSAAAYLLRPFGRLYFIYKAQRLIDLMAALRTRGLEPKRMRLIHSRSDMDGELVLVEACKGGGVALQVLPPLTIYENDGTYTSEMLRIFDELNFFSAEDPSS